MYMKLIIKYVKIFLANMHVFLYYYVFIIKIPQLAKKEEISPGKYWQIFKEGKMPDSYGIFTRIPKRESLLGLILIAAKKKFLHVLIKKHIEKLKGCDSAALEVLKDNSYYNGYLNYFLNPSGMGINLCKWGTIKTYG